MAIINKEWQITNIDNEVFLIQYPGEEREVVHFRGNLKYSDKVKDFNKFVANTSLLNEKDKRTTMFWGGYFYAFVAWG